MSNNGNGNKLLDQTICLDLMFRKPGATRKGDKSLIECEADKEWIGLSKKIINSPEYRKLGTVARDCRNWVKSRALPGPFKTGTYLIPLPMLDEIVAHVQQAETEYATARDEFLASYPSAIEEARGRLADQFAQENYPEAEVLGAAIRIERRLYDYSPPGANKAGQASSALAHKWLEDDLKNASLEIQSALREAFAGLVKHLRERLESISGGGKKLLAPSAVDNLLEFIDNFKHRNLVEDSELEGLVAQARNVLQNKDSGLLKANGKATAEVLGEMKRCEEAVSKLIVTGPKRLISFGEDE